MSVEQHPGSHGKVLYKHVWNSMEEEQMILVFCEVRIVKWQQTDLMDANQGVSHV